MPAVALSEFLACCDLWGSCACMNENWLGTLQITKPEGALYERVYHIYSNSWLKIALLCPVNGSVIKSALDSVP